MRSELADQQQRDQEGVVELQVEQQANLLEDRGIFEQLRLVDDDDGLAAVAVRLEDDFVNPVHEARAVHVGALLTQRVEDFGQEFLRRAAGVAQQGDLSLIRIQLVEEGPRHHRLPQPDSPEISAAPWRLDNVWSRRVRSSMSSER